MSELGRRSSARDDVFLLYDRHDDGFAARLLDFLEGGFAETVRVNRELLGELTVAKNLDLHATPLHQARFAERRFVHVRTRGKLLQVAQVDADDGNRERHAEAALRQTTLDRRLTTLKVELADIAALAGFLALLATTAG